MWEKMKQFANVCMDWLERSGEAKRLWNEVNGIYVDFYFQVFMALVAVVGYILIIRLVITGYLEKKQRKQAGVEPGQGKTIELVRMLQDAEDLEEEERC